MANCTSAPSFFVLIFPFFAIRGPPVCVLKFQNFQTHRWLFMFSTNQSGGKYTFLKKFIAISKCAEMVGRFVLYDGCGKGGEW